MSAREGKKKELLEKLNTIKGALNNGGILYYGEQKIRDWQDQALSKEVEGKLQAEFDKLYPEYLELELNQYEGELKFQGIYYYIHEGMGISLVSRDGRKWYVVTNIEPEFTSIRMLEKERIEFNKETGKPERLNQLFIHSGIKMQGKKIYDIKLVDPVKPEPIVEEIVKVPEPVKRGELIGKVEEPKTIDWLMKKWKCNRCHVEILNKQDHCPNCALSRIESDRLREIKEKEDLDKKDTGKMRRLRDFFEKD